MALIAIFEQWENKEENTQLKVANVISKIFEDQTRVNSTIKFSEQNLIWAFESLHKIGLICFQEDSVGLSSRFTVKFEPDDLSAIQNLIKETDN